MAFAHYIRIGVTEAEFLQLDDKRHALRTTWQDVGHDCFMAWLSEANRQYSKAIDKDTALQANLTHSQGGESIGADSTITAEETHIRNLVHEVFVGGHEIAIELLTETVEDTVEILRKRADLLASLSSSSDAPGSDKDDASKGSVHAAARKTRRKAS